MSRIEQVQEQIQERINYAKMLIRGGQVDEGLRAIDEIEQDIEPHQEALPPTLRYLIPFTRGRAYMQISRPDLAAPELEMALEIAGENVEAQARVRNLMGALLYAQEQPHAAIGHHLACVRAISEGAIKDLNFRFSVYYNLGNDYLSGNDMAHAIGSYKQALRVLKDLDASERAADVYWGLTNAYRAQGKMRDARMCAARAIQVYQATGNRPAEAAMHLNLAEILIDEERDAEATKALAAASALLADTGNHGLLSYMHRYHADLARRGGELDRAARYAEESIRDARELAAQGQEDEGYVWIETIRTLAEAFHAAALIEEARGNIEEADLLFKRSIEEIERTTVEVVKRAIHLSYGAVLEARGSYKEASAQFRAAAECPPIRVMAGR